MTTLWDPLALGRIELAHRFVMAPMTRSRANDDGTPGVLAAEYYAQRASLGLLISEGVQPSDDGQGYMSTSGIYRPEHVTGWRSVTAAVHEAGGSMFLQLMHVGRMSHPANTPHHRQPVAPSALAPGIDMFTPAGMQPAPAPREMTRAEIQDTIQDFRHAAASAIEAGADGIEIHGANGYLLHQFLSPNANHRTDSYGGSIENRARFVIEVAAAVADEIGADRVGIRISPGFHVGGIDEGPALADQYLYLIEQLAALDLAYLHLFHVGGEELLASVRGAWPGALMVLRAGRTMDDLDQDLRTGLADLVPLGRSALANPDIVDRIRIGAPVTDADPATFYGGGAEGYTDYPTLTQD